MAVPSGGRELHDALGLLLPEPLPEAPRWAGMPDLPDNETALHTRCVRGLIAASLQGSAIPAPGLAERKAGLAIRDEVLRQRLAGGDRRLGLRLADGLTGVLTDAMQFVAELFVPAGRLLAPRARPALAFRLARAATPEMDVADLPPTLGAVALAIDIADSRLSGAPSEADRIADNAETGCFVVGPWRAITGQFADRELLLEARGLATPPASSRALFSDPLEEATHFLARCRDEGENLPEGTVLLIVGKAPPLPVERGTSLVLAAGEIGTVTAEISG